MLISADSHVNPPHDMWREYLPAELRDRAPVIEETDDGQVVVFEGRRSPVLGINAMAGKRPEDFSWNIRRFDDVRAGGWEPHARLEDQDLDGVSAEVLYGSGGLRSQDPTLADASLRAYNDWLADFCAVAPDRLLGMAYLPVDGPDHAIAEARRCADKGLRGAVLQRFPAEGEWYDPRWDPFFATLADLDWPVGVHVGGRGRESTMPRTDPTGYITDLLMSKLALGEAISNLVVGGVLERHPRLKIVSVEGQIGWISFAQYYLDHIWAKHRFWTGCELPEPPSSYFHRQVWATFMEDPVGLREREHIGVDRIMWSSDYPHSETTWPDSVKLTDEWFADFPDDHRRKIEADNCRELYGL